LLAATMSAAQGQSASPSSPPAASGSSAPAATSSKSSTPAGTSQHSTASKRKKSRKSTTHRARGQQKIDPKRALEIQEALIREHYLTGKPTGVWNDATQQAMQKYQADNNWQSKTTPDARALIKLGLGPDHEHLLNPESAMTSQSAPTPTSVPVPSKQ
jgi:Putative peptidoglycan binding domain